MASCSTEGDASSRITSTPCSRSPSPILAPSRPLPTIRTCSLSRRSAIFVLRSWVADGVRFRVPGYREQFAKLLLGEVPKLPRLQVAQVERPELPAHQLDHGVTDRIEHPAND